MIYEQNCTETLRDKWSEENKEPDAAIERLVEDPTPILRGPPSQNPH